MLTESDPHRRDFLREIVIINQSSEASADETATWIGTPYWLDHDNERFYLETLTFSLTPFMAMKRRKAAIETSKQILINNGPKSQKRR